MQGAYSALRYSISFDDSRDSDLSSRVFFGLCSRKIDDKKYTNSYLDLGSNLYEIYRAAQLEGMRAQLIYVAHYLRNNPGLYIYWIEACKKTVDKHIPELASKRRLGRVDVGYGKYDDSKWKDEVRRFCAIAIGEEVSDFLLELGILQTKIAESWYLDIGDSTGMALSGQKKLFEYGLGTDIEYLDATSLAKFNLKEIEGLNLLEHRMTLDLLDYSSDWSPFIDGLMAAGFFACKSKGLDEQNIEMVKTLGFELLRHHIEEKIDSYQPVHDNTDVSSLTGEEYEQYCADILEQAGWKAEVTK